MSERIWGWKEVLGISLRCEWLTQSFREEWKITSRFRWSNYTAFFSRKTDLEFFLLYNALVTRFYWTDLFNICPISSWSGFLKGDWKLHFKDIKLESYSAKSASPPDVQKPNNKTKHIPEYNLNSNISPSIRIFKKCLFGSYLSWNFGICFFSLNVNYKSTEVQCRTSYWVQIPLRMVRAQCSNANYAHGGFWCYLG